MNDELTPPPLAEEHVIDPPPPPGNARQLRRVPNGSISGLSEGVGNYLNIDPNIVRVAFVVTSFAGGAGLLAYLAGWFLIPEQGDADPRPVAITKNTGATIVGVAILVAGISVLFSGSDFWIDTSIIVALALVGLGVWLLNQSPDEGYRQVPTQPPPRAASSPGPVSTSTALAVPTSSVTETVEGEYWASPLPDPGDITPPPPPPPPGPPIAAVTTGALFVVVGGLLVLRTVFGLGIGATAMAGAGAAIVGCGFVASAFLGRSRGLGLLAVLAVLGLTFAPLADTAISGGVGERTYRPTTVAELETFDLGMGDMLVDLSGLPAGIEEDITIELGAGAVEVVVPEDATVIIEASAMFGYVELTGNPTTDEGGFDTSLRRTYEGDSDTVLTIDASVTFGYVEVRRG